MPGIDVIASDADHVRRVTIQVKTRTSGTWHARVPRDAQQSLPVDDESAFWVFVDLSAESPAYLVAPRWWIRNDIFETHTAFLARHGGVRPMSPESSHHAITLARIEQWRDRWDVLGIPPQLRSRNRRSLLRCCARSGLAEYDCFG